MAAATLAPSTPAGTRTLRIAALATAGIAVTVAFMLWLAHTQITDYPTYDTAYAGAFETGVLLSVAVALLALVVAGATVLRRARQRVRPRPDLTPSRARGASGSG